MSASREEPGSREEPVKDEDTWEYFEVFVREQRTRLAALVNNAALGAMQTLDMMQMSLLQRSFQVNVFGTQYVTQSALPLFPPGGRIVNIGSMTISCTPPGSDPYAATKHALKGMSDSWRRELLDASISVSYVEPGLRASQFPPVCAA